MTKEKPKQFKNHESFALEFVKKYPSMFDLDVWFWVEEVRKLLQEWDEYAAKKLG